MQAKSMEGLIGADVNMKLSRTPMRVFREAERRGDTDVMKRAMGYTTNFQEKAQECSDNAQKALAKELKEERREQEIKREQAVEKRREEAKEYKENLQKSNTSDIQKVDSVEISAEGKAVLENNTLTKQSTAAIDTADVKIYTSEGKAISVDSAAHTDNKKIDVTL